MSNSTTYGGPLRQSPGDPPSPGDRAPQPEEARRLLYTALELGGEAARERAGAFPILEPPLTALGS